MPTLSGQRIFTIGHTAYVWEDIVLAGLMWGDWAALEARVRAGLACLARLDDLEEDDEDALDEADVETAAAEFRYARDLVAAADLEAWLERRGLSVDAWLDFIRRSLLLDRWADDLDEILEEYELDEDEVAEAVVCEALCSGVANDLAQRLAARAAVHARPAGETEAAAGAPSAEVPPAMPDDELLERAVPDLPAPARRERLARLTTLEAAWRRFAASVAPPQAMRGVITTRRLEWVRVVVQAVLTPDEDVAREVALCVRLDRRPIDEVADEAGLRAEALEWWLDTVEEALRDTLIGAQPGDVVGPVPWKEHHLVLTVTAKRLPTEDDPAVRARAEQALLARAVDREVTDRVTWHATL
jgi:hypothetical protein